MWGHLRFRARESQAPSLVGESLPSLVARARGMARASVTLPPPLPLASARALAAAASLRLRSHDSSVAPRAAPRDRSRSPRRPALPPLRRLAQGRRAGIAQGALPVWTSEADRQAALDTLLQDTHAPSSLHSMEAKLRTIGRALLSWRLAPFPPTLQTIHALGATLKRGGTVRRPPTSGCTRAKRNAAATPGWTSTTAP